MYQNSRLYAKSLDSDQLRGKIYEKASDIPTSITSCGFLQYANCDAAAGVTWSGNSLSYAANNPDCLSNNKSAVIVNANRDAQYYPCGLIANSYFTDEIGDLVCQGNCLNISFSQTGIAWPEDARQYSLTKWATDTSKSSLIKTYLIPPPQWRAAWPDKYGNGYDKDNIPDLGKWERFQVWMRKAGLPHFRKLWGISTSNLNTGTYQVTITDTWDAYRFNGTKALVFSEVGFMGPKNVYLGYCLLGVGISCFVLGAITPLIRVRTVGDLNSLSWNKKTN